MSYTDDSNWNDTNEIKCLIFFKILEADNFPRGKQMALCREIENETGLEAGSLSAKVSNFKSVAGINKPSNASNNTVEIYKKYKNYSITDLERLLIKNKRTIT